MGERRVLIGAFESRRKAQMFVEYIITFFIFMVIIIFLFTAFFSRSQPEAQKISEQSSNLVARSLAKLVLEDPGTNSSGDVNWESQCSAAAITRVGLAKAGGSSGAYILPAKKLDCFRSTKPESIAEKFGGLAASGVRMPYAITMIPRISGPTACDTAFTTNPTSFSGICNRLANGTVYLSYGNVSGSQNRAATMKITLFFPGNNWSIGTGSWLESDDTLTRELVDGGTLIKASTSVNSTDRDKFSISIASSDSPAAFIREFSYKYSTGENVGNFTISNSTSIIDVNLAGGSEESEIVESARQAASARAPSKRYAEALSMALINSSDGNLYPALIRVRLAKREITER